MSRRITPLDSNDRQQTGNLRWNIRLCAVSFRNFLMRIAASMPTNNLRVFLFRHVFGVHIGKGARLGLGCIVWGPGRIRIGNGSVINPGVILDGRFPLTIGEKVNVSFGTVILTLEHDLNDPGFRSVGGEVVIDDYAFIGAQAMILPGVHVGKGAAIAARAVAARDVEPYTIVAGTPAVPKSKRNTDLTY